MMCMAEATAPCYVKRSLMALVGNRRQHFVLCLALSVAIGTGARYSLGADGAMEVADILGHYEASLSAMRQVRFHLQLKSHFKGGPFAQETVIRNADWHCVRDDARWKMDCRQSFTFRHDGKLSEGREQRQDIGNASEQINIWLNENEGDKSVDVSARVENEAPPKHSEQEVLAHRGDMGRFATIPWPVKMEEGGFIFGYILMDGTERLSNLVAGSEPRIVDADARDAAGHRTILVESRGKYGRHRIWFDPDVGFLPRQVEVEKAGDDIFGSTTVAAAKEPLPLNTFWPDGILERVVETFTDVDIKRIGSTVVMVGFTFTLTRHYAGGVSAAQRSEIRLSDVEFNPSRNDSDFKITVPIPNGNPVAMLGAPQILYEWRDGQIKKVVDQKAAWALAGQRFARSESGGLGVPVVVVAASIIAALLLASVIWRRGRSSPNSPREPQS